MISVACENDLHELCTTESCECLCHTTTEPDNYNDDWS